MKRRLLIFGGLLLAVGLAFTACQPILKGIAERNKPQWRTAKVTRGRIVADVRATGKVNPVLLVKIGSFVSGPIVELPADFNDRVKEGDLLARIDPRLFVANVHRDEAVLANQEANVERAQALLLQAERNEQRAIALREENEDFMSPKEMDAFHFERLSLAAQLKVAQASIKQAEAALVNSRANLDYTEIRSPVEGIVTHRLINEGQTLASQFQTPELFEVAVDMDKKMHVEATVDEADIGLIIQAQEKDLPVEFRVDAYPDDVFTGTIEQVRRNSTATENVVTYPVIVATTNPDLKLLPGMTASLSFQVDRKEDVVRVPNAALRFYPASPDQVREEDRDILSGASDKDNNEVSLSDSHITEEERKAAFDRLKHRHVWVRDGDFLRAVEVEIGLIDMKYSELVSGELAEGDELVIAQKTGE